MEIYTTRSRPPAATAGWIFSTSARDSAHGMLAFCRANCSETEYGKPIVVTPGARSARSTPRSLTTMPVIWGGRPRGLLPPPSSFIPAPPGGNNLMNKEENQKKKEDSQTRQA